MFIRRKKYLEILDRIRDLEIDVKVIKQFNSDSIQTAGGWYSQIVQSRRILDRLLIFFRLQYFEEPGTTGIRKIKKGRR
jgi:hypothetical protein